MLCPTDLSSDMSKSSSLLRSVNRCGNPEGSAEAGEDRMHFLCLVLLLFQFIALGYSLVRPPSVMGWEGLSLGQIILFVMRLVVMVLLMMVTYNYCTNCNGLEGFGLAVLLSVVAACFMALLSNLDDADFQECRG